MIHNFYVTNFKVSTVSMCLQCTLDGGEPQELAEQISSKLVEHAANQV